MNFERLKKVRDFIKKLPPKACDMTTWADIEYNEKTKTELTFKEMKKRGFRCGSAACIGGWTELLAKAPVRTWLELDKDEYEELFMLFPYRDKGWKGWMLKRLDGVLRDKKVRPWQQQMKPRKGKK